MASLRTVVALGLIGLAVGFAIVAMRPGNPGRDTAGTDGAPLPALSPSEWSHSQAGPPSSLPTTEAAVERYLPSESAAAEAFTAADVGVAPRADAEASRVERLIAAGFSPVRAEEISRRESELRLAAFYSEYEATGTVRPFSASAPLAAQDQLRADLGDADFERYLRAMGQPTRVVVGSIDTASAAANAGLLPGDEILTYAGQRVFNLHDLNALMLGGLAGEPVPTTVVRAGQTLQLYVLRGPLGLTQP